MAVMPGKEARPVDGAGALRGGLCALALALVLVAGCAPKRIPISSLSGLGEFNRKVGHRTVKVVLRTGEVIYARNVSARGDSLFWGSRWVGEMACGEWTGERGAMPTAEVKAVRVHDSLRGAVRGFLQGGGCGLALAVPLYVADDDESYRGLYFLALPVAGAIIGIPSGMITYGEVYEF
jgi:hypothetical protein